MDLLIDLGNTNAKVTLSDQGKFEDVMVHPELTMAVLLSFCKHYPIDRSIICSVVDVPHEIISFLKNNTSFIFFDHTVKIPIENLYKTAATLGKDRLASAIGGNSLYPGTDVLVVDFGTAITYEMVNAQNQYLGGNITPGLDTRFKALNHFTKKLPMCTRKDTMSLLSRSTDEAITSGVQQGIIFEVDSYIDELRKQYPGLKVIFTGGDAIFFEKKVKNTIFAEPNLVFIGLNRILETNA